MVTANEFWAQSMNGKDMLRMVCRRGQASAPGFGRGAGDVEFVRGVCEWLMVKKQKDIYQGMLNIQDPRRRPTANQAELASNNMVAGMRAMAEAIGDGNCENYAMQVVDYVFANYAKTSAAEYAKAMAWFANELRARTLDD